jgi:hypothetical protein
MSSTEAVRSIRDKETRRVVQELIAQGHRAERTRTGHVRVLHLDGVGCVLIAGTPSDHRAHRNALALLRREGFFTTCE